MSRHPTAQRGMTGDAEPPGPATGRRSAADRVGGLFEAVASRPRTVVAVLAATAAVWALFTSATFFPFLSDNNDEAVYLLQADALRNGHLFPPAPQNAVSFTPWLGGAQGDRFVTKYTPVHPGLIAAARVLTGSDRGALAVAAAAIVVTCYLLAREILRSRRTAALAAGFLALSPVFLVQSGLFLVYLPTLALFMGFAAALLAAHRRGSARLLAVAGLVLGIAIFSRPYDTLLFAAPFGVWWVLAHRHDPAALLRRSAAVALGALPPVAAMLAYNHEVTGSVLRPVFSWLEASDTIGFGQRRMLPDADYVTYGPAEAWTGMRRLALLTGMWGFGGLGLVAFAVAGLRSRPTPLVRPLAAVALVVPAGYALFWGSWGSTEWGGPWRFGPLYYLPVYVPLVVLGAAGFSRLWHRDRFLALAAAGGMLAVTIVMTSVALTAHRPFQEERRRLFAAPLATASLEEDALVLLPQLQGPWLLQPFAVARNGSLSQRVLWALDRDDTHNFAVLDEFPRRRPWRVVADPAPGDTQPLTTLDYTTRLERLTVAAGAPGGKLDLTLEVRNPTRLPRLYLDVTTAGTTHTYLVEAEGPAKAGHRFRLRLGPATAEIDGQWLARTVTPEPRQTRSDHIFLALRAGRDDAATVVAQRKLAVRVREGVVQTLLPGMLLDGDPGHGSIELRHEPGGR